ncbi:PREDICTED: uncharacterized protein LOC109333935 [Lupinus angustifolius]|uniref:uncharacterized protein LOC109333935 n=1 Tax=Lupinus angustifolius TaxID=3871 RepID=UPI00092EF1AE|nr:PREDICTED: uncharacterized protein LOC109333935 [Lupinus angustifolius]
MAIESKNEMKFIDESLPEPSPDDPLHVPWVRCNNMMLSWIQHSIEGSIVKSILWINNASQVWKDLKDRCPTATITFEVITSRCPRWDNETMMGTDIHIQAHAKDYRDQDYVIRLLTGLKDQFSQVRSQIMLMEPLPNINKVLSLLIQQEEQFDNPALSNTELEGQILLANSRQDYQPRNFEIPEKEVSLSVEEIW